MKFLHVGDLHIGLKLYKYDLMEDQRYILSKIIEIADKNKPDAVLIAGDVYDKAIPSAEAVELFDWFVSELTSVLPQAEIMIISGNHDSAPRVNLYRNILEKQHIHMIGKAPENDDEYIEKIVLNDAHGPVNFYLLPFVKPAMIKNVTGLDEKGNLLSYNAALHKLIERENIDETKRNVLLSHQFYLPIDTNADDVDRSESEIRMVGNVDSVDGDILLKFDYAALGHIHKPWALDEFHRYAGTPLACSLSEAGQNKGVVMVEMNEKGNISAEVIPLNPLRAVKKIVGDYTDVLTQRCEDYVSIVITNKEDLNILDVQDRIRAAFPYYLEFKWQFDGEDSEKDFSYEVDEELNPFELCLDFLQKAGYSTDEDTEKMLTELFNSVTEKGE